jgi:hypothetical protein
MPNTFAPFFHTALRTRVLMSGASQRRLVPTSRITSAFSASAIVVLKLTADRLVTS